MSPKLQIILSASALLLACSTLAQDELNSKRQESAEYSAARTNHVRRSDGFNGAAKASEIIGMTVKNYQDEKLGKVEDMAVDVESGRIVQVILSLGGVVGVGDTLTAVPPGALHHDMARKVVHLDADKPKLKNAPRFDNAKWSDFSDTQHLAAVYGYYGEESAYRFVHKSDAINAAPNTVSTRRADGTWDRRTSSDSQSMIPPSRLGHLQKATKLMGTAVKNMQEEKIGKVDNLMVDFFSGRVVAVIVSSGGFLGLGDELSAVPPSALRFNEDWTALKMDASKEVLSQAPHFKGNQWPDFSQPSYSYGVYRAYNIDPYFTTNGWSETAEVDNSRRNVRDRDEQTLTPVKQGNSKVDVDTTAQIRKEIIASKGMSINARNVKVITSNGRVMLRGPVNSTEEKRLIEEIANRVARSENVDNQIEVKLSADRQN